jgi:hypothetical protein
MRSWKIQTPRKPWHMPNLSVSGQLTTGKQNYLLVSMQRWLYWERRFGLYNMRGWEIPIE